MRKRKLAASLLAGAVFVLPALPAASAEGDDLSTKGRFTTPFREDAAPYDASNNTFGGERGDDGCLETDAETGMKDCLPAGASQNVLADGRILYWNAIEGAEDLDQPDEGVAPMGGDRARNDRSRVLTLDWNTLTGANWHEPENSTGYFEGTPTEPPLIPGTSNENSNDNFNSDGSLFCSDQKQLADGTILAAGGTNYYAEPRFDESHGVIELEGVRNARIFEPGGGADGKGKWRKTGDLNYGRWYPSMVTLPDGDVFIASGVTKLMKPIYPTKDPSRSGDNVPETETYDVETGTWADNGVSGQRSLPLFPRLHLLPNGNVYYDAAGQSYNPQGQSYKQATWNEAASYNPTTKSWTGLGIPGLDLNNPTGVDPSGAEPGFRGSTFSQPLPLKPNGDGDYTSASYVTAGGVQLMSPGSYFPTDSTRINTVDVSGGQEALSTITADKLGRPRWYSSAVTLPTGQVLAVSGADVDEVLSPGMESPIRQAEMFTPTYGPDGKPNGGTWDDVAIANRKRTYHNNAVLLPDGRVLIGGHAPIPRGYYQPANNPDLPVREASNNFKDASFEIYEPPYLHTGEARPSITSDAMNPNVATGKTLLIPTKDHASISSVVLVRNPSKTHLIDGDQRVVELPILGAHGDTLQVAVTANKAVLPPGPYMLFINKTTEDGVVVPSVATQVFVDTPQPGWAATTKAYPESADAAPAGPAAGVIGPSKVVTRGNAAAAPAAPARAAGSALSPSTVASTKDADRTGTAGMLAVALGAAVVAAGSLVGTRRRRTGVRISG